MPVSSTEFYLKILNFVKQVQKGKSTFTWSFFFQESCFIVEIAQFSPIEV